VNHSALVSTWSIGVVLASAIALLARRTRALSGGGAVAAVLLGTLAMGAGWSWGIVLIAYFASAVWLSRFKAADKEARLSGRVEKQGARDAVQVIANGGVFGAMALCYWIDPIPLWQAFGAGALAASAADTWATELGVLARASPRSILDWKSVTAGTSGGVTAQGLLAGIAGASFMTVVTWAVRWPAVAIVAALIGGIVGCLVDSVVGASLQARRWCASCATTTEQRIHRCGSATTVAGGFSWLDNDHVNAIATIGGALLGGTVASFF
jgi:uncharacterized protein (TIGR00297 family)